MAPLTPEAAAATLSAEQKQNLHEVSDLMLQIYETLVSMRYIPPSALVRGPHTLSAELLETYSSLNLDASIIYLYSILPCINGRKTDYPDFFQGGIFFDQLSPGEVKRGRDPRYCSPSPPGDFDAENGEYMYPWYTVLSHTGNHSPFLIYDARRNVMWMVDQIEGHTSDPAFTEWYGKEKEEKEESNWGDESGDSEWDDEDNDDDDSYASSTGSSEFWSDEEEEDTDLIPPTSSSSSSISFDEGFEQVSAPTPHEYRETILSTITNQNSLEAEMCRPAPEVLRDINNWYLTLKELPGQGEHSGWLSEDLLRPLYVKNGWPDNFDGDAFEIDYARAHARYRAKYDAEDPLRQVECYEGWIRYSDQDIARANDAIASAQTLDDEWLGRIALFKHQRNAARNTKDLKEAREKAARLCPGGIAQKEADLPLWELEKLRVETQWKRESAASAATHVPNEYNTAAVLDSRRRRAERTLAIYEAALAASRADAERLCPGRTFTEATGIKSLGRRDTLTQIEDEKDTIRHYEAWIKEVRDFAATVPREAHKAVEEVEREIADLEKTLERCRKDLVRYQKWLEEHGNTD